MTSISAPARARRAGPGRLGLQPEAAVLAAQLVHLDARGGEAVLEGDPVLGRDVAVETVGVATRGLAPLGRLALAAAALVLDHAEAHRAALDLDGLGAALGALAQAVCLVALAAVAPLGLSERAGEVLGVEGRRPALGALRLAGGGRVPCSCPPSRGRSVRCRGASPVRRTRPRPAVRPGPADVLPARATLDLEPDRATGLARLDRRGDGHLGGVGAGRATPLLDDLRQHPDLRPRSRRPGAPATTEQQTRSSRDRRPTRSRW